MRKTLLSFSLLALATGLSAATFSKSHADVTPDPTFKHPEVAGLFPHIDLAEAQRLHADPTVVFVDGRSFPEWEESHIPGAVPLPVGEFDKRYASKKKILRKARVLVSYCHGPGCRLADRLADYLVEKGHKNVAVFAGGFPGWKDAGLPLVDKDGKSVKPGEKKAKKTDSVVNPGSGRDYGSQQK